MKPCYKLRSCKKLLFLLSYLTLIGFTVLAQSDNSPKNNPSTLPPSEMLSQVQRAFENRPGLSAEILQDRTVQNVRKGQKGVLSRRINDGTIALYDNKYHFAVSSQLEGSGESDIIKSKVHQLRAQDYFINYEENPKGNGLRQLTFMPLDIPEGLDYAQYHFFMGFPCLTLSLNFGAAPFYDTLLGENAQINILPDEEVDGVLCKVIEAGIDHRTYTVWLDPSFNFFPRKSLLEEDLQTNQADKPEKQHAPLSRKVLLHNISMERIDGIPFITRFNLHAESHYANGMAVHIRSEVRYSNIRFNPALEGEQPFALDFIPDGTLARKMTANHLDFLWRDGEFRPYQAQGYLEGVNAELQEATRHAGVRAGATNARFGEARKLSWLVFGCGVLMISALWIALFLYINSKNKAQGNTSSKP